MLQRHGFLLPSLLFLSGAPLSAEILERIIVKVNGEILTQTEFQARQLAAAQAARVEPDRVGQFLRENNAKILQEAIDDILLVQRAEDAGLRLPPHYIDDVIDGIKKDNQSEARADYDRKIADYTKPPTVSLLEILVKDEGADPLARAREILARARGGEDFASLARMYSASPTKSTGGDLGRLAHGDLNPELEKIAFALPVGAISDPIPSGGGYRILKVTEKTEGSVVPFDQAKEAIKQRVMHERWAKEYDVYIQDLRKKAIVDLRVREVPLQLTGPVPSPPEGGSLLDKVPDAPAPGAEPAGAAAAVGPAAPPVDPDAEIITSGPAQPERVAPPAAPARPGEPEKDEKKTPPPPQ